MKTTLHLRTLVTYARALAVLACPIYFSSLTTVKGQDPLDFNGDVGGQLPASMKYQADLFTGRFTYAIPLQVPPARQGSQPSLSLNYNSSGVNGWCGTGWSLELGFIQRDTRRGVPIKWDPNDGYAKPEYDDGKAFIFSMHDMTARLIKTSIDPAYPKEYRAELNTTFLRYRYWDQESSPYWEVIDKNEIGRA